MAGQHGWFTEEQGRWALRATFAGGAALACLVAGAVRRDDVLLLVGVGLMLVAYVLGAVTDAAADDGEPRAGRGAHVVASVLAFALAALAATALSAVLAIFLGAGAFRWMAACLPLAAAWIVISGAIRRLARRIARGTTQSHSRSKSTS